MLDIVDNTMFKDKGLFYAQHTLTIGSSEFSFSMLNNNSIEDFILGKTEIIENFSGGLKVIQDEISNIKNHVKVANFNQMAALHVNSPLTELHSSVLFEKEKKIESIDVEGIKQAHNVNLLKDKVSHLLED